LISILSTLSGGGASLLFMPLIAFSIGIKSVAPIMTLGIGISSSSRVFYFWEYIDWKLFRWLFPSTILGSVLGSISFAIASTNHLQIIIGIFLISTVFQFRKIDSIHTNKFQLQAWHFAPIGFAISFLSGLIGGVGPLMNSAYLNYGIPKEGLIGTRSANAVVLHISKIISYSLLGFVNIDILVLGSIIGFVSVFGNYIGKKLLSNMSDSFFQKIVVASMVLSGILILWKNKSIMLSFFL
jgi:uncharacterized protein